MTSSSRAAGPLAACPRGTATSMSTSRVDQTETRVSASRREAPADEVKTMPEFQLDTAGVVMLDGTEHAAWRNRSWHDLDAFTQGYIETLFFTSQNELNETSHDACGLDFEGG